MNTIKFCQNILQQKPVDWEPILRNNLSQPICNVDLVITVGGQPFHDDSVPVVGVNSDPTQIEEVEQFSNEFDANRSTGHLCAATVNNFQQVLDDILEGRKVPSKLSRISVHVKSHLLSTYALNDILIAHPCPATLSRFSFK
ncbi:nadh kinase [Quercus suber]|uniref:Nadh kinase n=1 Tax=Quercus suber TaxID=58331 RepID=A0AAW0IUX4_QUESU